VRSKAKTASAVVPPSTIVTPEPKSRVDNVSPKPTGVADEEDTLLEDTLLEDSDASVDDLGAHPSKVLTSRNMGSTSLCHKATQVGHSTIEPT
jgi:hypothetical protein